MALQRGQKWKVVRQPSSPVQTYAVEVPLTRTESLEKRDWAAKALPVRRWQSRQWQTETRRGVAETVAVFGRSYRRRGAGSYGQRGDRDEV